MATKKKGLNFAELQAKIAKGVPRAQIVGETNDFKISNYVPTGNYLLNAQLTGSIYNGIPEGRVWIMAGESGTGKTFYALNACREAQRKHNSHIIWIDTEGALDSEMVTNFGIDPYKFILCDIENIGETNYTVLTTLNDTEPENSLEYIFVIDSIGNVSTTKEMSDKETQSGKRDMTKQQELKALFRTILTKLKIKKYCAIVNTHTYKDISSYYPSDIVSGGTGGIYGASMISMFSKTKDYDTKKNYTGVKIKVKQYKSRFTKPNIEITTSIKFTGGMNKYYGLHDYVDWETCGIAPGKMVDEMEEYKDDKGKIKKRPTGKKVFEPAGSKVTHWAVEHLQESIPNNKFYKRAKEIFTSEVLDKLDAKFQREFKFAKYHEDEVDFDEFDDDENDDNVE